MLCPRCEELGRFSVRYETCWKCGGKGHIVTSSTTGLVDSTCDLCEGSGQIPMTKWGRCRSFGLGVRRLFAEATTLWHDYHAGTAVEFVAQAAELHGWLSEHLRERVPPDPDNQRLLDGLRWQHGRGNLLRFLDDPRIEPTNNRTERTLRPAVIAPKDSQCFKTQDGADALWNCAASLRLRPANQLLF